MSCRQDNRTLSIIMYLCVQSRSMTPIERDWEGGNAATTMVAAPSFHDNTLAMYDFVSNANESSNDYHIQRRKN